MTRIALEFVSSFQIAKAIRVIPAVIRDKSDQFHDKFRDNDRAKTIV